MAEGLPFLLFCTLGVFISYLFYGICQENLTKSKYGSGKESFTFFFSMLFCQCVFNSVFAATAQRLVNETKSSATELRFALCGFTYIGAMFASNFSLKFVSYPTQVIGKSIKPVPVMIWNMILAKRKYPFLKFVFISIISAGVFMFMYSGDISGQYPVFGWGEFLLVMSLLLDGITGGIEESLQKHQTGPYTLMLHMNLWSVLYLSCALLLTGEWRLFLSFSRRHPLVLTNVALFGLTSAIGQVFMFLLVAHFGSLVCAVVTTTRKFFTILASIILFSHAMSTRQWIGTAMVFSGIFLDHLYGGSKHKFVTEQVHVESKEPRLKSS